MKEAEYKVGDEVWWIEIDMKYKIMSGTILEELVDYLYLVSIAGVENDVIELRYFELFPTKEALIKHITDQA